MKKITFLFILLTTVFTYAQTTGTVVGKLTDKEYNDEPLAFANVLIKGTTKGTTSDFDGLYTFSDLEAGDYTLVYSFVGYETQEIQVTVVAGKVVEINVPMAASAASLDEVVITTTTKRESETALLLEQKKAVVIKESIGAERLSKIGVSDAAAATTKISGVTQSEGSGEIYIRGLGDRYLSTTMNGLAIPSDDVDNKNINLDLFSTQMIENVGISKTYNTNSYADQTSGNIDIASKAYSKKGFNARVRFGYNTNVLGLDGDFKRSVASEDVTFGFHKKKYATVDLITRQGWDPLVQDNTANFNLALSGGTKFQVFGKDVSVFAAGSHSNSYEYQSGLFRTFRSNVLDNEFTDVENFTTNTNSTGYINLGLKLNNDHRIKINGLSVNKSSDNVYEQGRNGEGYVFDQDPQEDGAFVRDQNFKQTILLVNQIQGTHQINETNKLEWAGGYNYVLAEEPNRIRNEANILDENTVQYAHVGDFQQRKSSQKIEDTEFNAYIKDHITFGELDEDDNRPFKLNVGGNFRKKERVFSSQFIGVRARGFQVPSVDQFSLTFTDDNFENGLVLRDPDPDRYDADLNIMAGYASLDFGLNKRLSGNVGVRFERDEINVLWDVGNYVGRVGSVKKEYNDIYPSVNLKYGLNEKHFLRFASSFTQVLPEFKELSPFEYVSPTGRVTRGDPNLEKSDVFNADLKWEFFPKSGEVVSATAFYKQIKNPINLALTRGSAGIFQFSNTGEEANVFGLEVETRLNLIENEDNEAILNFNTNVTQMWFNQDLFEEFQYKDITESSLQGASDFILNGSLSYNSQTDKEFIATLTGNYSSDKVFALGAPEDFDNSDILYNDEIIEKGFLTLDLVMSKQLSDKLLLKFIGRNLLNPKIEQTQKVKSLIDGVETNEVVSSYKNGSVLSLSLKYSF
ncbi:carboxypeptidase-like regulatory domain-containing protein [Tamlana sp. 2201CG12-4]|uniref:TonB-dependent receptor n=1 Tax=Tamlana sp. 2201CG12-4 TaxID=3112582 RepID=UPI002DC064BD|nr:carboxypeptidase-like regulatory domain-containing protein [Tamlana sp. 2201CG12-4]MEC3905914.1 carboxypeptidase-like regulatory domain-containing protein [Tamlana sp. 2201CG12-4]